MFQPGCILLNGLFLKFLLQRRHSITHLISSAAVIFHGLSDLMIPGCQLFYLLFQFLDLTTTPKKIAVVLKSSTGMEPPGLKDSPSNVTIRILCRYFLAMAIA